MYTPRMHPPRRLYAIAALAVAIVSSPRAQSDVAATLRAQIDRIYTENAYAAPRFGPARWLPDGVAYAIVERGEQGAEIARYDAATGARSVLATTKLDVDDYSWSSDGKRLLVFTNTKKVWRQNTRGDYYVIDVAGAPGVEKKLGGTAPESSLMFAKFSPDATRVAYVRQNNIYVEQIASGAITQLTSDGTTPPNGAPGAPAVAGTVVNGTSDWVNEEELDIRDGFRWSPDGARIAYWQFDTSGVRDFLLINNTDSLYSFTIPVQYPKAGTTNSAAQVGVVSASGGNTVWLRVPGDPRNNYIAKLDWAGNSAEVVVQQLNRLQNTLAVMLGDARTGQVRTVHTERDSAWVDVGNDLRWLNGGRSFTWISERDGYRHLYLISRDGKQQRLLTPGSFDLHNPASAFGEPLVVGQDSARGWIYYTASPENATQLYLFRSRIDGKGQPERLTPRAQSGYHRYFISSDGRWAIHNFSSFGTPPITELVSLPEHKVIRTLVDNRRLRDAVAKLTRARAEFVKVAAGPGLQLDAWVMKPPGFDSTRRYPVFFEV